VPDRHRGRHRRLSDAVADWDDVRRLALALPETGEKASYGAPPAGR
jgi:hypothetical protein